MSEVPVYRSKGSGARTCPDLWAGTAAPAVVHDGPDDPFEQVIARRAALVVEQAGGQES